LKKRVPDPFIPLIRIAGGGRLHLVTQKSFPQPSPGLTCSIGRAKRFEHERHQQFPDTDNLDRTAAGRRVSRRPDEANNDLGWPVGYGKTKRAAIDDLMEQMDERDLIDERR